MLTRDGYQVGSQGQGQTSAAVLLTGNRALNARPVVARGACDAIIPRQCARSPEAANAHCSGCRSLLACAIGFPAGDFMASVLIRHVDDALHTRLKASAAAHRRSLEEEARELLRAAVARQDAPPRENLVTLARRLFGSAGGADLDIPPRGAAPDSNAPDFSGPEHDPAAGS